MFNLHGDSEHLPYDDCVSSWKKAMQDAYLVAGNSAKKNAKLGKSYEIAS